MSSKRCVVLRLPDGTTRQDAYVLAREVYSNFLEYYSNFLDKKLYNNNTGNYECSKLKIKKEMEPCTPNV